MGTKQLLQQKSSLLALKWKDQEDKSGISNSNQREIKYINWGLAVFLSVKLIIINLLVMAVLNQNLEHIIVKLMYKNKFKIISGYPHFRQFKFLNPYLKHWKGIES